MLKLVIHPGVNMAPVVVFDETASPAQWCLNGFDPRETVMIQRTPLWRSAYQFLAARFNAANDWAITVDRSFSTELAAQLFKATYPLTVPFAGELELQFHTAAGSAILYCKSAARQGITFPQPTGQNRVITQMTWSLGAPWSNSP